MEILFTCTVKYVFQYSQTFPKSRHIFLLFGGQGVTKFLFWKLFLNNALAKKVFEVKVVDYLKTTTFTCMIYSVGGLGEDLGHLKISN